MAHEITEVTRRNIIDYLVGSRIQWSGRLPEDEFLSRLYDLTELPSTDSRLKTAASDIRQHRMSFLDWSDDWVFFDERFNLIRSPDEHFLRFLCETLHPIVRPDSDEAKEIAKIYNNELKSDGWQIIESKQMSGHPVFVPERINDRRIIFQEPTGWPKVDRQFQEVRQRLDTADTEEQYQAIGLLCREILISTSQAAYVPQRHKSLDGVKPSDTDAGRILESIFEIELQGGPNEEARTHAKAALRLANALQHKRTADYRTAALCSEATASVVNLLAVLSGKRRKNV